MLFQRHDDTGPQYSLSTLLPLDQLHVWHASLDVKQAELDCLETVLSRDERDRASRFHFLRDRCRFAAGRGILRKILAYYLGQDPRALEFGYGRCGKPYLKNSFGVNEFHFNLAHSHGVALYGIVRNQEIGVDLERVDRAFDVQQIAEHFFSRRECYVLRNLPARLRLRAFLNCWTRKEAYVKAHGAGLLMRLDNFDVSLIPGRRPALSNGGHGSWSIYAPKVPGYAAAVVVQGTGYHLKTRQWSWHKCERHIAELTEIERDQSREKLCINDLPLSSQGRSVSSDHNCYRPISNSSPDRTSVGSTQ